MKMHFYFKQLSKKIGLTACLLAASFLEASQNSSQNLPYISLEETQGLHRQTESEQQLLNRLALHQVFESFEDPLKNPLYDELANKIDFVLRHIEKIITTNEYDNSQGWLEFKEFLEFYAPGSERYNKTGELQRSYIDELYQAFGRKL